MNYLVAVSGGVDSVVLLDMLVKQGKHSLIVAHFDHGIRSESAEDEVFVRQLAESLGLTYVSKREVLGSSASEALARDRRYAFLKNEAKKHQAQLVTAHHLDDLVESIAINLHRGTGWRGVAVFGSSIERPLLNMPKAAIIQYAKANQLEWREDATNSTNTYLRNRLRKKTASLSIDQKRQLHALQATQKQLHDEITKEVGELVGKGPSYSRYLFTTLPIRVALECLRVMTQGSLTRPQLERLLHAIKTTASGKKYEAGSGIIVQFSTRNFTL